MTSQNKNGGDRVVLGEMAFSYDNVYIIITEMGKVKCTYLLTRQTRTVLRPYQNLGLVSLSWIISRHITPSNLLPSWFHVVKSRKQSLFWLLRINTRRSPLTKTAILSIIRDLTSLWIRSKLHVLSRA